MNLHRLMTLRKQKGWSLQFVSDQLGMAKSTYAGYESGYRRPSLEAIAAMADLFDTSVDFLLGRSGTETLQQGQVIELTNSASQTLSVDGAALSNEEIKQLIAFVRVKRAMDLPGN